MPELLTDIALTVAINDLDGWRGDRKAIRRSVEAPDFPTAIRIVDAVAIAAENMNHHPDIDIRWRNLHFLLTTHDAGGVTELDTRLAANIDAIVRDFGGK